MTTTKRRSFKHSYNIDQILSNISCLKVFSTHPGAYLAGGFPSALLFGAREEDNLGKIQPAYYDDIDVFFTSQESFAHFLNLFNQEYSTYIVSQTENAITYSIWEDSIQDTVKIQLVKKFFKQPTELIETFDIINCCVCYSFSTKIWHLHSKTIDCMANKKLSLLNPVMLDENHPDYPNTIGIQLERFSKYISRYDLDLDLDAMKTLSYHSNKNKELTVSQNKTVYVNGYYRAYKRNYTETTNLWQFYSSVFVKNYLWKYFSKYYPSIKEDSEEAATF